MLSAEQAGILGRAAPTGRPSHIGPCSASLGVVAAMTEAGTG